MSSTIEVTCPHCGMLNSAPANAVGKQGRCCGCRQKFEIAEDDVPLIPGLPTEPVMRTVKGYEADRPRIKDVGGGRASVWCPRCRETILGIADRPNHVMHLLLTVLTISLWAWVWLGLCLGEKRYRCSKCGTRIN